MLVLVCLSALLLKCFMPSGTREIRRRIKSVSGTKKITKAMEMVAAAKMRKAVAAVLATRDYANLAWVTIMNLAEKTNPELHPLLNKAAVGGKICVILIGSNRGLCAGFNLQIVQKTIASIKKHEQNVEGTDLITLGSRSRDILRGLKLNVVADFAKEDLTRKVSDVSAIAKMLIDDFIKKKYSKVFVAFTDFETSMKQIPRVKQLLPIEHEQDEFLGVVGKSSGVGMSKEFIEEKKEKYLEKGEYKFEYLFEPSADQVLKEMLPRLIEMQIYQAVLESEASEHSARMTAMRNATDAAGDMIDDLTLTFNRARQAGITQEISEISAGAAALS